MSDDALIRALLSGGRGLDASSLLAAGSTPQPQGTFGDVAQALALVPEVLKAREKEEAERRHLERTRELEVLTKEQGLEKGKQDLEGVDRSRALEDFERRKDAEFGPVLAEAERKTKLADEARALDPDNISALDREKLDIDRIEAEARRSAANRPPEPKTPARVGVTQDGQPVFRGSSGLELADGTPYSGEVFASSPSASERKEGATLTTMLEDIRTVAELAGVNLETAEFSGSINTGPIAGPMTRLGQRFTGVSNDKGFLITLTENLSDQLLRARSGAQINEKEFTRLRRLLPNINEPESTFAQKTFLFARELENTIAARGTPSRGSLEGGGVGVPGAQGGAPGSQQVGRFFVTQVEE